jgi:hypothetical protein
MQKLHRAAPLPPAPAGPDLEARATALLQARRGRKPIQPPPSAAHFLAPILKPLLANSGLGLNELRRNWAEIVGAPFAQTEPEKLFRKTLTLRVPGALAAFVQHSEGLILERCRTAGAKIDKILIRHGQPPRPSPQIATLRAADPAEAAALEGALGGVDSPRLKAALLRLSRAVRSA